MGSGARRSQRQRRSRSHASAGLSSEIRSTRSGWALTPKANLIFRTYVDEAITSVEDGNRARLDFNYRF